MQQTDWKGLSADEKDGFVNSLVEYGTDFVAPLYSVVEKIEEALQQKNSTIRAQADARPIGKVLSEEEMGVGYDRRTGPVLWFGTPKPGFIYTHPEASAPGLSEPAFWISKSDADWLERVPNVNGQIQALRLGGASRVPVFLTRASAATVAEPKQHDSILITLRQAEALVELFGGHDCEIIVRQLDAGLVKMDDGEPESSAGLWAHYAEYPEEGCMYLGPSEVDDDLAMNGRPRASQQQAEPGADERAAFLTWWGAEITPRLFEKMTPSQFAEAAWIARAAQSGQRAEPGADEQVHEAWNWTGNADADAALLMLDRLDVSVGDDARVDAIAATIRRLAAQSGQRAGGAEGWQPIETAPKDGRTLLLGYPNSLGKWRTTRGQWMSDDYIVENWEEPDNGDPGWFETSVEADDVPNCWGIEPTHWMPLPAAPTQQQEGE